MEGMFVKQETPYVVNAVLEIFANFIRKRLFMNKRVLGMGNAVLDILAETEDEYLIKNKLQKGSMVLVEQEVSDNIIAGITPKKKKIQGGLSQIQWLVFQF